jgi:thioredoxin-related protein
MTSHISFTPRYIRTFLITVLPVVLSASAVTDAIGEENKAGQESAVVWHTFDEAQRKAAEERKPLFLFVEADWCVPCKQMKREVFPGKEISRLLNQRYYAVSIDVDSRETLNYQGETLSQRAFVRTKKVTSTPTMIFLEPDGTELGRRPGAVDSDELVALLKYVDSEHFGTISLEEFKKMDR